MNLRIRALLLGVASAVAAMTLVAPAANASLLSILPGSCGNQPESQPFQAWGDSSYYTPVPGGSFEAGSLPWLLTGGAHVVAGNENFNVSGAGANSLSLPAGSVATSPASCTNIYHPTARFFVRNTGSASSRLTVQAIYPGLLGFPQTATLGKISGTSGWAPSPTLGLFTTNLLATLSLDQTAIAFRFIPADSSGSWSIDDVYLDPFHRG
jgi:hypothetical protein